MVTSYGLKADQPARIQDRLQTTLRPLPIDFMLSTRTIEVHFLLTTFNHHISIYNPALSFSIFENVKI